MKLAVRVFFVFVLVLLAGATWAKWYKGIIHIHSTRSDGGETEETLIRVAQKLDCDYMIFCDHYDKLYKDKKLVQKDKKDPVIGKTLDLADILGIGRAKDKELVFMRGAEISSKFEGVGVHLLALGEMPYDQAIWDLQFKEGSQDAILKRIRELGLVAVVAHPSLFKDLSLEMFKGNPTRYTFDHKSAQNLDGMEFFNVPNQYYEHNLMHFRSLTSKGQRLLATSGCDYHNASDYEAKDRLTRFTYVWSDGPLTKESLIEALKSGRTVAARNGVKPEDNFCPWPEFSTSNSQYDISLKVRFEQKLKKPTKIQVYRNGQLIGESEQLIPAGQTTYQYNWVDENILPGKYFYFIEIPNLLITSSFCFERVVPQPVDSPNNSNKAGVYFKEIVVKVGNFPAGYSRRGFLGAGFRYDQYDVAPNRQTTFSTRDYLEIYFVFGQNIVKNQPDNSSIFHRVVFRKIGQKESIYDSNLQVTPEGFWRTAWTAINTLPLDKGKYEAIIYDNNGKLLKRTQIEIK